MKLNVLEVALQLIRALRPLILKIAKHDRSLADHLKRSSTGVALGLGEGAYSRHGNQIARFTESISSCSESRLALKVAVASGYLGEVEIVEADEIADRVMAMTYRLIHPRR